MARREKSEVSGHNVAMVDFDSLRMAAYNPRMATGVQIDSICRSIAKFGIVDPFILRSEDHLVIGGHQRVKAVRRLLEGLYVDPSTKAVVEFALPKGQVPAVLVGPGLSDKDAKLLNLSLNKTGGDWDSDKLAELLRDLVDGRPSFDDMLVSGFGAAEIAKMIAPYSDEASEDVEGSEDGMGPKGAVRGPKMTLDFTLREVRDAVKAKIVARNAEAPSGDVLALLLRVIGDVG